MLARRPAGGSPPGIEEVVRASGDEWTATGPRTLVPFADVNDEDATLDLETVAVHVARGRAEDPGAIYSPQRAGAPAKKSATDIPYLGLKIRTPFDDLTEMSAPAREDAKVSVRKPYDVEQRVTRDPRRNSAVLSRPKVTLEIPKLSDVVAVDPESGDAPGVEVLYGGEADGGRLSAGADERPGGECECRKKRGSSDRQ